MPEDAFLLSDDRWPVSPQTATTMQTDIVMRPILLYSKEK
jgi:hypothetical protein